MSVSEPLQVLHFSFQNVQMCIPLCYVNKILPLIDLEKVPSAPNYFVGLLNLAGQSVPIIDLAIFLNQSRDTAYILDTPILLCRHENNYVGLVVDKIMELVAIDENTLQMQESFQQKSEVFKGVVNTSSGLALLLNFLYVFKTVSVMASPLVDKDIINKMVKYE